MASVVEALALALQFHQAGNLQVAEQLYGQILANDPHHADALHLRGLIAFETGRHELAVSSIGKAITSKPGVPEFHSNMGLAQQALGKLEEAVACYQRALQIKPTYTAALSHLGNALRAQGKPGEAAAIFHKALRLVPDSADIHNNLGNALFEQKQWVEAEASYREALRLQPNFGKAYYNLANALKEQGKLAEAIGCFEQALRWIPDSAEVQNNLGDVLREMGRLGEAREYFTRAIRFNPQLAQAYSNMGLSFQEEGRLQEAVSWFQQALRHEPNSAVLHCNLGCALTELREFEDARNLYDMALRLEPDSAEAHNGLGFLLFEQGSFEEARKHYDIALRLKPTALAHRNLATMLQGLGAFEEAEASFRAALKQEPRHAEALAGLAMMLRGKLPEDDLLALKQLLAGPHLTDSKRMALHFALAHVLDARGAFEQTAELLQKGNALRLVDLRNRGKVYDPAEHVRFVDSLISTFTLDLLKGMRGFGIETERPLFIVGLPRSGTTLTEQVLASHSQVYGAGELSLIPEAFELLPHFMNRATSPIECVPCLDLSTVRRLGQWHEECLRQLDNRALRVTDKLPSNYLYLGLIATLFPKAKVIHCRRELRDVALSCWMTNFLSVSWACDPEHIVSHFQQYRRVMQHWRQVLPGSILEVDYEEMVANFEGTARRLVEWVGLDWESACLEFYKTARPVHTASVTQVRQPIYTRSVGRWKKYEKPFASLFAKL